MTIIRLLDARRGLNRKCEELFKDPKISESIYRFLCDGIEECEDAEPERKRGKWERHFSRPNVYADLCWHCSVCGGSFAYNWANKWNFCPDCGAKMDGKEAEDE